MKFLFVGAERLTHHLMTEGYSSRVVAFRNEMAALLPRAPNSRASREALLAMPTRNIISAFVTWRMRLIPAKPRTVRFWSGGVPPSQAQAAKRLLEAFLRKVTTGKDLTPHLSDLVNKKGVILPGANLADRGKDIDMILTRQGLHHFHIGVPGPLNRKGRSGTLVFAEVLPSEFRVVALADHRVFDPQSPERLRFWEICHAYMAKDVPRGQAFMANPVTTSGHSMVVLMFAVKCEDEMRRIDPLLDDPAFVDKLYGDQPILRDGQPIYRPAAPSLQWYFDDLKFGILDKATMVFFCIYPFFSR